MTKRIQAISRHWFRSTRAADFGETACESNRSSTSGRGGPGRGKRSRAVAFIAAALAVLSFVSGPAGAGLVGATVKPTFYADIPEFDDPPKAHGDFDPTQIDDGTVAPFVITNGSSFTFFDYFYSGAFDTFMRVTLTDTQIILTNLIPGAFPEYTAAGFKFLFPVGRSIVDVTADVAASSPLFLPGSVLSFTGDSILLVLSDTCSDACVGITTGGPGERIVLNVTAVPEPASLALLGIGLLPLVLRRRKVG